MGIHDSYIENMSNIKRKKSENEEFQDILGNMLSDVSTDIEKTTLPTTTGSTSSSTSKTTGSTSSSTSKTTGSTSSSTSKTTPKTTGSTTPKTTGSTIPKTTGSTIPKIHVNVIENLTKKQRAVLDTIVKQNCITSVTRIASLTNIKPSYIRDCIKVLKKHNILSNKINFVQNNFKGFRCEINIPQEVPQEVPQLTPQEIHQGYVQNSMYSSSSYIYNKTTTIETVLNNDPEFFYWRDKKLTHHQIKNWSKKFNISPFTILDYLRYCRFDMVDLNQEVSKKIDSPISWFYTILKDSKSYPKPNEYKTFLEKENERQEAEIKLIKKENERKKQLLHERTEVENESKFLDMLSNPNTEEYKTCYEKLNKIQKDMKGGDMFITAMKYYYYKIYLGIEESNL